MPRPFRFACVVPLLVLLSCSDSPRRPNVILIVIDTLRADHLSGYGYRRETTPHLDRLMDEGVRFDRALAVSSWSAPSHVSIITGARDDRHQVQNWEQEIAPGVTPAAVPFRAAGYRTGLFSTHLALHKSVRRIDEGIDHKVVLDNRQDRNVLPQAAAWAKAQEQPFFLYVCLMGPHAPYNKYPQRYDRELFTDVPPGGEATWPFTKEAWYGEGGIPTSVQLEDRHDAGYYINRYDRAIRYTDELIGEFLAELEAAGLLDDTLIAITSDHGEGFGEHGCFAHELYLYDFLIRVPWILWQPGRVPAGRVWNEQVSLIDLVPTLLGLCGIDVPASVDGHDLSPWLDSERRPAPRVAFASYRCRGFDRLMAGTARHKLILDQNNGREELYDLAADPKEERNLLQEPRPADFPEAAYLGLRAHLRAYLDAHEVPSTELPDSFQDPAVLEELIQLGYVDRADAAREPPKDRRPQ